MLPCWLFTVVVVASSIRYRYGSYPGWILANEAITPPPNPMSLLPPTSGAGVNSYLPWRASFEPAPAWLESARHARARRVASRARRWLRRDPTGAESTPTRRGARDLHSGNNPSRGCTATPAQ